MVIIGVLRLAIEFSSSRRSELTRKEIVSFV